MKVYLLMMLVILCNVQGALSAPTVQELLQSKDIAAKNLVPALRIACAENNRNEAIRAAIAVRDFAVLAALLYKQQCTSLEDLKLVAVSAGEQGCNLFHHGLWNDLCCLNGGPGHPDSGKMIYLPAAVMALRNGHRDLAHRIVLYYNGAWPIFQALYENELDSTDRQNLIQLFSEVMPDVLELVEGQGSEHRDHIFLLMKRGFIGNYARALSHVENTPRLHSKLKKLLVGIYIHVTDALHTTDQHGIRRDAMAKVRLALEAVFQHVEIRDVMSVICEFLDSEHGRLLAMGLNG